MSAAATIPDPALVVLVGASGSGKSTWAGRHYRDQEIASSDGLRAVVGSGPNDLDASDDAFAILDAIVLARSGRRLTVVVDTLGLDAARRRAWIDRARETGLAAVAVVLDTPAAVCRARNRSRDRPVPATVLDGQLSKLRDIGDLLEAEGWDRVVVVSHHDEAESASSSAEAAPAPAARSANAADRLSFVYQISRFPWGDDPAAWLAEMVAAAADSGFDGIALMDHLIQIPQVGRAWEPLPESFVTLGMLAGLVHGQSRELRLGTLVSPATFRRPGITAKAVATLDVLTGGRTFCGIGAGWFEREHLAYGLDFPPAGGRLDLLEEAIETLRALWAPGTKAYKGTRVSLPETTCYPRPVSDIPIIVGGGGESRTLRIAAALGDACNVRSTLPDLDRKIAVLRRHCVDVGRDPADVAVTVLDLPVVGADRSAVADLVERFRGRMRASSFVGAYPTGTTAEHVARYRDLAERGVETVFVAPFGDGGPADVERFAPITAAFAGQD